VIQPAHRFEPRPFLLDLGALALIVLAPFVVLLSFHGYSYFTPEVLLIVASGLAAAAVSALLVGFTSRFIRVAVLAGLIALFIDMHVNLAAWSSLLIALTSLGTFAAVAGILWLLREHATTILCVVFVTLIGLTLMRANPGSHQIVTDRVATAGGGNAEPPLLIHLLLDEHIGVEGLPPEIPGTRALRIEDQS
jgi:hypothetical protein